MKTTKRIIIVTCLIALIGFLGGLFLLRGDHTIDFVNIYLDSNLISLYLEPCLFILIATEISWIKPIRNYVVIRHQNKIILKRLIVLILIDWDLFYSSLLIPYLLLNKPLFSVGNAIKGSLVILAHIFLVLLLCLSLLKIYQSSSLYFLLFVVILLTITYHFSIEKEVLLPFYSQFFDPLWRAKNKIYG